MEGECENGRTPVFPRLSSPYYSCLLFVISNFSDGQSLALCGSIYRLTRRTTLSEIPGRAILCFSGICSLLQPNLFLGACLKTTKSNSNIPSLMISRTKSYIPALYNLFLISKFLNLNLNITRIKYIHV